MTPTFGTERTTVQNHLIQYAGEIGWTYLSAGEAPLPPGALVLRSLLPQSRSCRRDDESTS
jgi:hypothetical protein